MTTDLETPETTTSTSEPPVESVAEELAAGACCSECGVPGNDLETSWCRSCGYYSKYGTYVDLDDDLDEALSSEGGQAGIPPWAYKCASAFVAVIALSVVARLVFSRFPFLHMVVGTSQLLGGVGVFLALHFVGFFKRSLEDSGAKLMDFLSPFAIWAPVFHELPKTERRVIFAWTGLCAAFFSLVITGGQPTSWLEFKETVILKEEKPEGPAGPGGAGDDLEGAVKDFAEKGTRHVNMPGEEVGAVGELAVGGDGDGEAVAEEPEEEEEELLETECLVVGYMPGLSAVARQGPDTKDGEKVTESAEPADTASTEATAGETGASDGSETKEMPAIRALVLASQVSGRLCIVGYATEGLTVENARKLLKKFSDNVQETPSVRCRANAVWLKPKFICKVKYKEWDPQQGLIEPQFDGLVKVRP